MARARSEPFAERMPARPSATTIPATIAADMSPTFTDPPDAKDAGDTSTRLKVLGTTDTRLRPAGAPSNSTGRTTGGHTAGQPSALRGPPAAAVPPTALEPGMVVKNRFLLEQKIGEGGMGVVFRARDVRNEKYGERVAIKFLGAHLEGDADALEALQHEVRRAHELAHPNIVSIYDFDQDGALSYIYMELLEGQGLDKLLRKTRPDALPFSEAWPIIAGAGAALSYAHARGIVHSDFKPGNVFLTNDHRVKVLDFAIARAIRRDANEFDASVLGGLTPAYASPEMALRLEPDPRDDVYALACVAYELLAGRHPFNGKPAHRAQHENLSPARIPGLSRTKMRALARGLSFTRGTRTPSVDAFLDDLGVKTVRRRRLTARVAAAAGIAAAAMAVVYWYSSAERCAANDADFLSAVAASGTPLERNIDASYRGPLLEQGQEYLASATAEFDPSLLSKGASSDAFHAFENVLRIDASNADARNGVLRIIDLYAQRAAALIAQGNAKGALDAAGYGLELHPRSCKLNSLKEKALALLD
jgi:serine/threonine protein kinase